MSDELHCRAPEDSQVIKPQSLQTARWLRGLGFSVIPVRAPAGKRQDKVTDVGAARWGAQRC